MMQNIEHLIVIISYDDVTIRPQNFLPLTLQLPDLFEVAELLWPSQADADLIIIICCLFSIEHGNFLLLIIISLKKYHH